jgi:hypothetical protein
MGYSTGYVWVNGQYQGYVPAGKTKYTLMEGFVTNDSGFQPTGTLKQTYSHAGWKASGDTIRVQIDLVGVSSGVSPSDEVGVTTPNVKNSTLRPTSHMCAAAKGLRALNFPCARRLVVCHV